MTDITSPNPEPAAPERDDSAWLDWAAESRRHISAADGPWAKASADVQARALLDLDAALVRAGVQAPPSDPLAVAQRQYDQQWQFLEFSEGEGAAIDDQIERVEALAEGNPAALAAMQANAKAALGTGYDQAVADADVALASIFDGQDAATRDETRALVLADPLALRLLSARGRYIAAHRAGRPR